MNPYGAILEPLTRISGVRSALLVSEDDGLIVADTSMAGEDGAAAAALTASLVSRLRRALEAAGHGILDVMHLEAEHGDLLAVPAAGGLLLVAVARSGSNVGLLRLSLRDAAERIR